MNEQPTSIGIRYVESRIGRPVEDYLRDAYLVRELNQQDIADEIGVDISTVSRWMRLYGIQVRVVGRKYRRRRAVAS